MTHPDDADSSPAETPPPLGFWATVGSVAASFFGVQSQANRERDFTRGKASHFIIIGVVMTLLLIAGLVAIVQWMLHRAGM